MYKLLSFDVYGTLVNTPPANAKAFQAILKDAGATNIDPIAFYRLWESRNVAQYRDPYRSYKANGIAVATRLPIATPQHQVSIRRANKSFCSGNSRRRER
jgi:hypothetical protein